MRSTIPQFPHNYIQRLLASGKVRAQEVHDWYRDPFEGKNEVGGGANLVCPLTVFHVRVQRERPDDVDDSKDHE